MTRWGGDGGGEEMKMGRDGKWRGDEGGEEIEVGVERG